MANKRGILSTAEAREGYIVTPRRAKGTVSFVPSRGNWWVAYQFGQTPEGKYLSLRGGAASEPEARELLELFTSCEDPHSLYLYRRKFDPDNRGSITYHNDGRALPWVARLAIRYKNLSGENKDFGPNYGFETQTEAEDELREMNDRYRYLYPMTPTQRYSALMEAAGVSMDNVVTAKLTGSALPKPMRYLPPRGYIGRRTAGWFAAVNFDVNGVAYARTVTRGSRAAAETALEQLREVYSYILRYDPEFRTTEMLQMADEHRDIVLPGTSRWGGPKKNTYGRARR